MKKLAFLGAGNLADAMISALLSKGYPPGDIYATDKVPEVVGRFAAKGLRASADNKEAARFADLIFITVKPQQVDGPIADIRDCCAGKIVLSSCAGVKAEKFRSALTGARAVVRFMPNTPVLYGKGVLATAFGDADEGVVKAVTELFTLWGEVVAVEECMMDAVTALSGSGPAYFYIIADALAKAAAARGLDYKAAALMAAKTMEGAAAMMQNGGKTPEELVKAVASPGGTTEAALKAFAEKGLTAALTAGFDAACDRAAELSQ